MKNFSVPVVRYAIYSKSEGFLLDNDVKIGYDRSHDLLDIRIKKFLASEIREKFLFWSTQCHDCTVVEITTLVKLVDPEKLL